MRRLKCNIFKPRYLDFYTRVFLQESGSLKHNFMFPLVTTQGDKILLGYSKFALAAATFLGILIFEKCFIDAWLIPSMATLVFVIPFVEEFGKFLAVKYRFIGFFLVMFLGAESYFYIAKLSYLVGLKEIIIARLLVCTMHIMTTYFQWIARTYSEKHNKQHHVTAAFFLSVMIHAVWNYGL